MTEESAPAPGRLTRRRVLQTVGAGTTVALAGCIHSDDPCDLTVTKEHSGDTVTYGGTADFEITVCNDGDQDCTDPVTVTDNLPAGTTFDSFSGSGWSASQSGGTVTFEHQNANALGSGDCLPTLTLTIAVGQPSAVGSEIANCVSLGDADENLSNNRDCVVVPVESGGECDLGITKRYDGDVITAGGTATFQIEVCNEGDGQCLEGVTVVDGLPSGTAFDSGSGTGWTVTQSGGSVVATHANSGGLDPGECLPVLELTLTIGPMSETGDQIRNCANLKVDDSDATNDTDCVSIPVQSGEECDLGITKRYDGDVITAGTTATFQIEVCNESDSRCVEEVTVVDTLPSGTAYDSASGSGWSISQSGGSVVATHANSGGLAPGDCLPVLELTLTVGSMSEVGDQIRNCATLKVGDSDATNDTDCVSIPVQPAEGRCDLAVTKTHTGGDVVTAGGSTTFDIVVCNVGDGDCPEAVTVVDDLPAGTTFDSASGSGWSVTQSGGVVTATHANNGGLAPGDCLPALTLTVGVGSIDETGDQFRNCASIEGDDANASNDRDCAVVTVTQPVDGCNGLTIEKEAATQFTYGQQDDYEITVCNPTDAPCDGQITVVDDLPGGMSYAAHSGSGWSVSASGGVVTATHANSGGLAPGDCLPTLTLTVDVVPAAQFPGGSDAVQNCAELLVNGAVVDEGCVTHVIFNV